jgi:hypothetical protein
MWNLLDGTKPSAVDNTTVSQPANPGPFVSDSALSQYVLLPFGQPTGSDFAQDILVHGKEITNGIVNLLLQTPSAQSDWVLHVSYIYNTTLLMSQGTCDYIF